jgi:hypothetical protein
LRNRNLNRDLHSVRLLDWHVHWHLNRYGKGNRNLDRNWDRHLNRNLVRGRNSNRNSNGNLNRNRLVNRDVDSHLVRFWNRDPDLVGAWIGDLVGNLDWDLNRVRTRHRHLDGLGYLNGVRTGIWNLNGNIHRNRLGHRDSNRLGNRHWDGNRDINLHRDGLGGWDLNRDLVGLRNSH